MGKRPERQRVYVVFAMGRSGHHAVLTQICRGMNEVTHFNNCVVRRLRRRIEPRAGRFIQYHGENVTDSGIQPLREYRRAVAVAPPTANAVYSFEEIDISRNVFRYLEPHRRLLVVCINRDPFNWLASRYQKGVIGNVDRAISCWKKMVRESLGRSRYVKYPIIDVNYNRWFQDLEYRQELNRRLGLSEVVTDVDEVCKFGGEAPLKVFSWTDGPAI